MLEVLFHGFLVFWTVQLEAIMVYAVNFLTVEICCLIGYLSVRFSTLVVLLPTLLVRLPTLLVHLPTFLVHLPTLLVQAKLAKAWAQRWVNKDRASTKTATTT